MARKYCLICRSNVDEVEKMHNFPRNDKKSKIWQENMGIKCLPGTRTTHLICCRHFSKSSYANLVKRKLRTNAIPSLFPCPVQQTSNHEGESATDLLASSNTEYAVKKEVDIYEYNAFEGIKTELVDPSTSDDKNVIKMKDEHECKFNVTVGDLNEGDNENHLEFIKSEELILKDEGNDYKDDPNVCEFEMDCANSAPMGTRGRAARTVPTGTLELRPSVTNNLGIYTLMPFEKGVQFGPYEGKLTTVESTEGCCWKLENGKLVDESDDAHSNYMRYINCAGHVSEQNLEAFQCNGELYYQTSRDVLVGEELLIHFDNSLDHSYYRPPEENKPVMLLSKYVSRSRTDTANRKGIWDDYEDVRENLFKCSDCDYESQLEGNLVLHKKRMHDRNNVFKCTECDYVTHVKQYLRSHKRRMHEQKKVLFKCTDCDYATHVKAYLLFHKRRMHDQKKHKCTDCDFETHVRYHLVYHKRRMHERNNVFKCTDCDYETHVKDYLVSHKRRRHGQKKELFKCTDCDYETDGKDYLLSHKIRMHEQKNQKCTDCDFETHVKYYLGHHKKRMHERNNVFKCTGCDYETHFKDYLLAHKRRVHEKRKQKCTDCDFETHDKYYLANHKKRMHERNNMFKCTYCEYETHVKDYLVSHKRRVHAQKKVLFKCIDCDFETRSKKYLSMHKQCIHAQNNVLK